MFGLDAAGFGRAVVALAVVQLAAARAAQQAVDQRALHVQARFAAATPRRTGATAGAWRLEPRGDGTIAVVNARRAADQFVVASGLITGTGGRGVATSGYLGGFRTGWPGMAPAAALHAAWEAETRAPYALAAFLPGRLP